MTRTFIVVSMLSLVTACGDNPYLMSKSNKGVGQLVPTFAYGRFCGPGNPVLFSKDENDRQAREVDLRTLWPPADDIDAVCYAHDYCVQQADQESVDLKRILTTVSTRQVCDDAFVLTLYDFNEDFTDARCFNLANDMAAGIMITDEGKLPKHSREAGAAIVLAALSRMSSSARAKTTEFPDEGTCNLISRSSATMILDAFEYYFDKSRPSFTDIDFSIPRIADDDRTSGQ